MKKLYDFGILAVVAVVAICAAVGYASYLKYGPDNLIEEISEKVIEEETGVDVDLTPSTPEKSVVVKKRLA